MIDTTSIEERTAGSPATRLTTVVTTPVVAALVFWTSYDGGTYGLMSRASLAIAIWWTLAFGAILGVWALRPSRATAVAGLLLAALAILTLVSAAWSASAEAAVEEFNRVTLLLGIFALGAITATAQSARRWSDGIAAGIVAVAVLALVSRLFPGAIGDSNEPLEFVGGVQRRLYYPVGYWTGLGVLVALAFPPLLRAATVAQTRVVRASAVAAMPVIASTLYLSSARLGVLVAVVAVALYLVLAPARFRAALALAIATAGAAAAVALLHSRPVLVDGPFESAAARMEGPIAAAAIAVVCAAFGVLWLALERLPVSAPSIPGAARYGAGALCVVLVIGAAAASDPRARLEAFKGADPTLTQAPVDEHIMSASGNGRWQLWSSAIDQWREHRFFGDGAGSFAPWWLERGGAASFARDAHSLFLETLGELGLAGLALVVALIGTGAVVGVRRVRRTDNLEERSVAAALSAAFGGFVVAAAMDWMWELTAVAAVGMLSLGVLGANPGEQAVRRSWPTNRRRVAIAVAVATAAAVVAGQVSAYLSTAAVYDSQQASRRGNLAEARQRAVTARDLQPWAASPYLQLALVDERRGDVTAARRWIGEAIKRARSDWRLWLVASRLEVKAGVIQQGRESLDHAIKLNPRSPLFSDVRR